MKAKRHRPKLGVFSLLGIILLLSIVAIWLLVRRDQSNPRKLANPSSEPAQSENSHSAGVPSPNTANPPRSPVSSQPAVSALSEAAIPDSVQTWLHERLTPDSFTDGIELLKDASLSEQARLLVLDKLHSWRRHLTTDNLKALLAETKLLAIDANLPRVLRSRAVSAMATILVVLQEQSLLSQQEVESYSSFLTELGRDEATDALVRGRAIRALGLLKTDTAGPVIRELLAAPENWNNRELARDACLALVHLGGSAAVPVISQVLENTTDEAVFGTAAFALGQIQTPESLAALVRNESHFPSSGSADAALVEMEDVILRILGEPNDPNLVAAIEATRHLWKDGQRERYAPLLRSLAENSPAPAQQAAVSRLIEDSRGLSLELEQQALAAILPAVANNPQLAAYAEQIQIRLNAKPLVPNASAIPTQR